MAGHTETARMSIKIGATRLPLLATIAACLLLFAGAAIRYYDDGFLSLPAAELLLRSNAYLGVVAIGMTFVILSGGIDLSVGAMVAFTTVMLAQLIESASLHPLLAIGAVLALGTFFGGFMGSLIHFFRLPAFLITLGGMFLARGIAFNIEHPFYDSVQGFSANVFPAAVLVFALVLALAIYIAHWTRFGRSVYAVGGSESSAELMGLSVARTKVGVYALSGCCAAFGGVVLTLESPTGNATAAPMLELEVIAAVVIGGTLLTGGIGYVFGTLFGVLIYGIIQLVPYFEPRMNQWWARIAIGVLLLGFILLQKLVQNRARAHS
jgi:simple sugar transport system permease protein